MLCEQVILQQWQANHGSGSQKEEVVEKVWKGR